MKSVLRLLPVALAALLGACTWGIKLDAGGRHVRALWSGDVGACRDLGKVTVSVLSRVGPVDRNDYKVRDELEVMARNEAAKMGADTIKPLGDPKDGEQSWEAYACGAHGAQPAAPGQPSPQNGQLEPGPLQGEPAQTFPAPASTSGG